MAEYIDREKTKEEILSWAVCINNPNMLSRDDTLHCIDAIPAADVATVVRGRWDDLEDAEVCSVKCSNCGEVLPEWYSDFNYCPNCGARMDGTEVTDEVQK